MAGLNYFGLLRRRFSVERLAEISGMTVDDIRHCSTTGSLQKHDHRKFKKLWQMSNERNRSFRLWR